MATIYGRPKLRIGVWKEAFAFPFRNFFTLVQFSLVPTFIAVALSLAILYYAWPSNMPTGTPEELKRFIDSLNPALNATDLVTVLFGLVIAVCIHRLIILGERPGWIIVRFGRYEIAYVGAFLVFILVTFVVMLPIFALIAAAAFFGLVPAEVFTTNGRLAPEVAQRLMVPGLLFGVGVVVTVIVAAWVQVRLALIFPHAAVTGRISLGVSWNAMKGNFWRYLAAALILGLVLFVLWVVVGGAIFAVVASYLLSSPQLAGNEPVQIGNSLYTALLVYICSLPLYIFGFSMFVAFISYAYADLVDARAAAR